MKLRVKLLIPTIFFAIMFIGVLLFIFIENYTAFHRQNEQQTHQQSLNMQKTFSRYVRETRGFIRLINENEVFISGVMVNEQLSVLDIMALFTEHTTLDFVTVYTLNQAVFAQTLDPIEFGKPDKFHSWIQELAQTDEPRSIVRFFHHKLVLLTGQRIQTIGGPVGVTVVGMYMNDRFVRRLGEYIGSHVAIMHDDQLVSSSLGLTTREGLADYTQTTVNLFDTFDAPEGLACLLLEDNVMTVRQFQRNILVVLLVFALSGIITIAVSLLLSQSLSSRLRKTLEVLESATSGVLSSRVPGPFLSDEIGELQQGLNTMTTQLEEMVNTLEQRVVERTHQLETKTEELVQAKEAAEQARERAEIANQAKTEFLSKMSHELRTPLNAILGFSHVLPRRFQLDDEQQDYVRTIIRSGEHLLILINRVLEVSKIEAGHVYREERDIDLYHLLDELQLLFQLKADKKHVRVHVKYSPEVPRYIRTDDLKLRQILANILENAVKFTEHGGVLLCVTSNVLNEVEDAHAQSSRISLYFEVEDTGSGIAPDDLERIFDAFMQTETGRQAREGTGLGLTLSREYVHLLGGSISVASDIGKGTVFSFHIPVSISDGTHIVHSSMTQRVVGLSAAQPQYRILIADDLPESRELLWALLEPVGFALQEAQDGQEVLRRWQNWHPDLILLDMHMPVLDGYEVTRRIKASAQGQSTVVIAVTASTFEEDRLRALDAGCDDFLSKPYQESALLELIQKHLHLEYMYATQNNTHQS